MASGKEYKALAWKLMNKHAHTPRDTLMQSRLRGEKKFARIIPVMQLPYDALAEELYARVVSMITTSDPQRIVSLH